MSLESTVIDTGFRGEHGLMTAANSLPAIRAGRDRAGHGPYKKGWVWRNRTWPTRPEMMDRYTKTRRLAGASAARRGKTCCGRSPGAVGALIARRLYTVAAPAGRLAGAGGRRAAARIEGRPGGDSRAVRIPISSGERIRADGESGHPKNAGAGGTRGAMMSSWTGRAWTFPQREDGVYAATTRRTSRGDRATSKRARTRGRSSCCSRHGVLGGGALREFQQNLDRRHRRIRWDQNCLNILAGHPRVRPENGSARSGSRSLLRRRQG